MRRYAKAIAGGLTTSLGFAIPLVDDGLLPSECLGIVAAFVAGFQAVYWTRNRD
jgi:hypothetical protein